MRATLHAVHANRVRGGLADRGEDWRERAACKDTDGYGFHPDGDESSPSAREVYETTRRDYCARCPVILQCLRFALSLEEGRSRYGMWGGLSPRARQAIPADERYNNDVLQAHIDWALRDHGEKTNGGKPGKKPRRAEPIGREYDHLTFTYEQGRAAANKHETWRRGAGPELTPMEWAAMRSYKRTRGKQSRAAKREDRKPPTSRKQCGTRAGYSIHRRNNERPCAACRSAENAGKAQRQAERQEQAS